MDMYTKTKEKEIKIWFFLIPKLMIFYKIVIKNNSWSVSLVSAQVVVGYVILLCIFLGGWLLVSNVVFENSPSQQFSIKSSYRDINNCHRKTMFLSLEATRELRAHLSFTQLRFHCSKQKGRTFHVTTAPNSNGEAVINFFSGQTNSRPNSCGSFVRMKDDNSMLAQNCQQWKDQKWGDHNPSWSCRYKVVAFVYAGFHWLLQTPKSSRWECDDYNTSNGGEFFGLFPGDFWKVYVR